MGHVNVNPAQLVKFADQYTELAARTAQVAPLVSEEIERVAATHGPMGQPAVLGMAAGLAARQPQVAAKTADFVDYSQRFIAHSGTYVDQDQRAAGGYTAVDFKTAPPPKDPEVNPEKDGDKKPKSRGGSKSKGKGTDDRIEVSGEPEQQWGTPTDPHEMFPNNPGRTGTFDGDHGEWEWQGPGYQGGASAAEHSDGYTGQAGADAWGIKGDAEWKGDVFGNPLTAGASGMVGADSGASATVTDHGVSAHANAFVGAEVGVKGDYSLGPVDLSLGAAAQLGAGGNAGLDFGMQDGKFVMGGSFGAAWGPGGKISPHIAIDPKALLDTVNKASEWLDGLF
ncbi:type VII secretion target [Mycolicibacterium neoaurum]|uniref:type VII secretion target n=1 Tax=Mycolicibacterium neoaurum TaxID=1795 RepID=UPI001F4CE17D|nr:type VII secretion target [Mycolicibacterium neoaurum]